jgi:hypothetical protein
MALVVVCLGMCVCVFVVAPIVKRWLNLNLGMCGLWRRPIDSTLRRVDQMEDNLIARGKGQWITFSIIFTKITLLNLSIS